jgi:ATP-dependent DNA helicase PIF1
VQVFRLREVCERLTNTPKVFILRIILFHFNVKLPFILKRRQFSVSVYFVMIINKSERQSLQHVVLFLRKPVFNHSQLYITISRVTSKNDLKLLSADTHYDDQYHTKDIVY